MSEQEYGDVAYAPFGETYSIKNTPYLSFTGQQQDTISGTYDFLYREYNPVQGRWISPDPSGLAAVEPSNPQSWNRYAYVGNNPLTAVDALGLDCVYVESFSIGDYLTTTNSPPGHIAPGGEPCLGDNAFYFEGTVDPTSVRMTADGDVVATVDGNTTCSGDCSDAPVASATVTDTFSDASSLSSPANNGFTWAWNFTKSFFAFAGGPGNVPTCAGEALRQIAGEFVPISLGGASVIQATAPGAQAVAINQGIAQTQAGIDAYIAGRGLTVPLRSSVVRAMAAKGAESAVAAGARANIAVQTLAVDYAAVKSTITTAGEARSGQCAAAFPVF
jgi:RHS repeat-associated protein